MTNMQPTKQDRITSVLRKIRAYQNKPIVVAPGDEAESVLLHPIEAILLANHITHLEDMIASLENLVSEHENDVGVYKRRAMKLEGQVLAQRKALSFAASCITSGEPWTDTCESMIAGALTDTAQAGREAEARVVEAIWDHLSFHPDSISPRKIVVEEDVREYANRLRNGGSTDGE